MHGFITGAASAKVIALQMMDEQIESARAHNRRKAKRAERRARKAAVRAEREATEAGRRSWRPPEATPVSEH
jgi:hypothetical protein